MDGKMTAAFGPQFCFQFLALRSAVAEYWQLRP
jgi:hypothetical protein